MGTIYNAMFDRAIDVGLTQTNQCEITLENFAQNTFQVTGSEDSNPLLKNDLGWGKSGSDVANTTSGWGLWEASSGQTAYRLRVKIDNGSGTFQNFLLLTGGGFPANVPIGATVDVDPGFLQMQREGLAQLILDGISNTTFTYLLMDGSQNVLPISGRVTPQDTSLHSSFSYNASDVKLQASGDVTFQNQSGTSWTVEEFRVVFENDESLIVLRDQSISTNVSNGDQITFTTVENDLTL